MGKVYTLDSLPVERAAVSRHVRIQGLWLEYRVACQFEKCWSRVEAGLELAAVLRGVETPGQLDDAHRESPHASYLWIEQTDGPPLWFKRDELGLGGDENYFDLRIGMGDKNKRRLAAWVKSQALEVRKVIKRTVHG